MLNLTLYLPKGLRLDIKLVKGRKLRDIPSIIPSLGKVFRARKGNKLSRFFRLIFEHDYIKRVLGTNLALLFIASSLIPKTSAAMGDYTDNPLTEVPYVMTTVQGRGMPVGTVRVTQGYSFYHRALDLDGVTGDTITPIMTGTIESTGYSRVGYGYNVIVDHNNGYKSLYAHLSKITAIEGQVVDLKTKIGEMGATGRSFGDHLHLEVYQNGKNINPFSILPR